MSSLPIENSKPSVSDFLCGKLNHAAEKLIGTLSYTYGFDLEKLIKFLKVALNLCKMYPDIKRNILCLGAICTGLFKFVPVEALSFF